jgi:hypothetical protein
MVYVSIFSLKAASASDTLSISRDSVVAYAKNYLSLPYRYAGRNPATGFDCSGFTRFVFNHFNIKLSSSSAAQAYQGDKILWKNALPGDLVFFRRSKRGRIFHVALVSMVIKDSIFVIHSTTHGGVRIDNLVNSPFWKSKYKSLRNVLPGSRDDTHPNTQELQELVLPSAVTVTSENPPMQERQPLEKIALLPTLAIFPQWKPILLINQ